MSEQSETIIPTVGMGVTMHVGSDSYAGTIVRVTKSGKTFVWKQDHVKLVKGSMMSEDQVYEYSPNEAAREQTARKSRRSVKNLFQTDGMWVSIDYRRYYRDPCF